MPVSQKNVARKVFQVNVKPKRIVLLERIKNFYFETAPTANARRSALRRRFRRDWLRFV